MAAQQTTMSEKPAMNTQASDTTPVAAPNSASPEHGNSAEYAPESPPPYVEPTDAAPPSYDSIFGKVKQINEESSSKVDCARQVCQMFCSSVGCLVLLLFWLALPISMIVMGSLYLGKCPVQPMVPIYLVVGGATGTAYSLIALLRQVCNRRNAGQDGDEAQQIHPLWRAFDALINAFSSIWFIVGNWAVYSTWRVKDCQIYSCDEALFCNPYVLLFAFWLLTATYILCACIICCGIPICCITACASKSK